MALKRWISYLCNERVQLQMEIRKISPCRPRSVEDGELGHITLLLSLQRTVGECTKAYNQHVQLLFGSLNLLFGDVVVTVLVVVFLISLF